MQIQMDEKILIGIASALIGAGGTLIAIWLKWGMEKRKLRFELRRKFIEECRQYIQSENFDEKKFVSTALYPMLKPHLDEQIIAELETDYDHVFIRLGGPHASMAYHLLESVKNLEIKWGLI